MYRSDDGVLARVLPGARNVVLVPMSTDDGSRSTAEIATDAHVDDVRRRLVVAGVGALPVMVLSMIPSLQFDGWQWVSLVLAAPVVTWSALPFHRAAWRNALHRTTTMDTLVSLGVIAATVWSLWALVFGGAGTIGMTMDMSLFPRQTVSHGLDHASMVAEHHDIYLEVATTLTAFILAENAIIGARDVMNAETLPVRYD